MPVTILFCYAREDEELLNKLKTHLRPLQWDGFIDIWYDRDISAGTEWEQKIKEHLNAAQIILLLVSPDFMNSDYCYGIEMKRALERHERGEVKVIPVILRPTLWSRAPFSKLQVLPTNGKPVTVWHNLDSALNDVAQGIDKVVEQLPAPPASELLAVAEVTQQLTTRTRDIPPFIQQKRNISKPEIIEQQSVKVETFTPFQRKNLNALEPYRLLDPVLYQQHCSQDNAYVAGLRENRDGLVIHHYDCKHIQNALDKPDLTTWPKFGILAQDFLVFQNLAHAANVPLFFTCTSRPCHLNLQRLLGSFPHNSTSEDQ